MEWWEKVIKYIKRGIVGPEYLAKELIRYSRTDRTLVARVAGAAGDDIMNGVYAALGEFPWTDFGWSMLPDKRAAFESEDLNRAEQGDLDRMPFQEDREHVEYLRNFIRPGSKVWVAHDDPFVN